VQKILALCACDVGTADMYLKLTGALSDFSGQEESWERLIHRAEQQGIAPLLYKHIRHLEFEIPANSRRLLQNLYLRNRRSNTIRNKAVIEIVSACGQEDVDVMPVKGIALCNFAYSEIGLRPMRDIDLLVKKEDIFKAKEILLALGYLEVADHSIPFDYYHLAPLEKTIDGLPVGIELHHNLLPFHPQYPLWPFMKSVQTSREILINETVVQTLSLEDTLYYCYLHGFQAPLTYEPYRLMHVADINSLLEKYSMVLNWHQLNKKTVTLLTSISRFHFLTPWTPEVIQQLDVDIRKKPRGVGQPFCGWPLRKVLGSDSGNMFKLLVNTMFPSQWWMQLYYGHQEGVEYWKARFFYHPRTIWRWIKMYWTVHLKNRKDNPGG